MTKFQRWMNRKRSTWLRRVKNMLSKASPKRHGSTMFLKENLQVLLIIHRSRVTNTHRGPCLVEKTPDVSERNRKFHTLQNLKKSKMRSVSLYKTTNLNLTRLSLPITCLKNRDNAFTNVGPIRLLYFHFQTSCDNHRNHPLSNKCQNNDKKNRGIPKHQIMS